VVADFASDLNEGVGLAQSALESGATLVTFEKMAAASQGVI
jgi:anthranilate phosphoribosyltransferase